MTHHVAHQWQIGHPVELSNAMRVYAGMEAQGLDGSQWLEVPFVETAVKEITALLTRDHDLPR
jgi:hypothetical protein